MTAEAVEEMNPSQVPEPDLADESVRHCLGSDQRQPAGREGVHGEMVSRLMEQTEMSEMSETAVAREESFCPECGQSLDLARHAKTPVKRRTREPFVFLVFGLCLTVVFGLRTGNALTQLSSVDQQIAALRAQATQEPVRRPGNPSMIVADTLDEVLTNQIDQRVAFQRDVTGLGLGLLTLVVGAVSWLHGRLEPVDGRRMRMSQQSVRRSDRPQIEGSPWHLGGLLATTLVRMLLLLFATNVGLQLIRGTPPSLQLVDEALTRIIAIVVTIANPLQ